MIEIPVGKNAVAKIDDADLALVGGVAWYPKSWRRAIYAYSGDLKQNRPLIYMHRLIAGAPAGMEVDHINGDGLDNRGENLRVCTHAQNLANQRISRANTSGYKGVSWDKKRGAWEAHIKFQQKKKFLGYFAEKEDAARAYNAKAVELFGDFARINQIS